MKRTLPSLLQPLHTDEFLPVAPHTALARATAMVEHAMPDVARTLGIDATVYAHDPRATALALRAIDTTHGGGFYAFPRSSVFDADAVKEALGAVNQPVVDVQTHLVDPTLWVGPHANALGRFLQLVDPERWPGEIDPRLIDAAAWASLMFGTSETAVALLTSTPGPAGENVLENAQIAAVRDVTDRYAGSGRVLTHTIAHPNLGPAELDRVVDWSRDLRPSAWKVYTLAGPPTAASPTGGWFLDDAEVGLPFLERVQAVGPKIVCAHKGLGGPIPDASVAAASPRDIGPAAAAFPDLTFVVYHSGYDIDPIEEGAHADDPHRGVSRLVTSLADAGVSPSANVYAELGSTWFLMLRRPCEAAHVLGKLLLAVGEDRILWGTDSVWYGPPQSLIDAFRAFQIPERMQEEFGYPPLSSAVKEKVLGTNAAALYGIDHDTARAAATASREWLPSARTELAARLA